MHSFIQMFHAVAFVAPEERVEIVRAGIAANESALASTAGIAILFGLGFALAALGAVLAARKQASAPTWAVVVAAFVAFAGVTTAVNVQARGAQTDEMSSYVAERDAE